MSQLIMGKIVRLNATIPPQIDEFIIRQVESGRFSTKSDFLRHVLREKMEEARQQQIKSFNKRIKKSVASGLVDKTPAQIEKEMDAVIERAAALSKK